MVHLPTIYWLDVLCEIPLLGIVGNFTRSNVSHLSQTIYASVRCDRGSPECVD